MTKEKEWASKLITLNDGTKIKPLPTNMDSPGYAGPKLFMGTPQSPVGIPGMGEDHQNIFPSALCKGAAILH
eukprot:scaffold5317_cov160-Amphora_coffeaeformis.AAC.2